MDNPLQGNITFAYSFTWLFTFYGHMKYDLDYTIYQ